MHVFVPAAVHSAVCTPPVALAIHPPAIAPTRIPRKANARRFRLAFDVRRANRAGSDAMSHSRLVTTTVGISLKSRMRLPIIWPAAWKLRSAMGARDFQSMRGGEEEEEERVGIEGSMVWVWKRMVEIMMKRVWMRKERARVPRRRGWRMRQRREKKNAPRVKQRTEVRDLAQPYGLALEEGLEEGPRPMKMVLPLNVL